MAQDKKTYHEKFAEQVLKQIENGTAPWMKPWRPEDAHMPFNPSSKTVYKGANRVFLAMQGYADPRWKTFNQARSDAQRVKKGEHGTPIVFWQWEKEEVRKDDAGNPVLDAKGQPEKIRVQLDKPLIRASYVFNGSQIEGMDPWKPSAREYAWAPEEKAENIMGGAGVPIVHDQRDRAYYSISDDSVHLPQKESFGNAAAYYDTALHEIGHATGHSSRLNRQFGPFGSEDYAREELRAEIASWMVSAELGIPHNTENHASYVNSWQKVLKDDPFEIVRACRDAEKIMEYLMSREKTLELEEHERKAVEAVEPATDVAENSLPGAAGKQSDARTYLDVPYKEKEQAKKAGAKWDWQASSWYAPIGTDLEPLRKWVPKQEKEPGIPADPRMEFAAFIKDTGGLLNGELPVMDGRIHRIPAVESRTSLTSFAYCGYGDGVANGWVQNYNTGEKSKWVSTGHVITDQEKAAMATQAKERREQQEKDRAVKHDSVAKECEQLFSSRLSAQSHPYLEKKGIQPEGLKASTDGQALIAPLINTEGKIRSLQYIHEDGSKRFHPDGEKSGNFFLLGARLPEDGKNLASSEIVLCEGVATGQTIREAVDNPVAVCFDSGNLEKVAMNLREKFPNAAITICADNDHKKNMNMGVVKAQKAAAKVQGKVIVPFLNEAEKSRGFTDFNDLKASRGISEVKRQIARGLQLQKNYERGMAL